MLSATNGMFSNMTLIHHVQNFMLNIESANLYLLLISAFVALTLTCLIFAIFGSKKIKTNPKSTPQRTVITSQDIKAIAGDSVMATQLDLARAYIEMDNKQLAKKILEHVIEHGEPGYQQQAHALIATLEMS